MESGGGGGGGGGGYRGFVEKAAGELVPDVATKVGDMDQPQDQGPEEAGFGFGVAEEPTKRKKLEPLCETLYFNAVVALFIILNLIFIGIERDYGIRDDPPPDEAPLVTLQNRLGWYICEFTFTLVFFIELVVRLRTYKFKYFRNLMNFGDFLIVVIAIYDCWFRAILVGGTSQARNASMLRVFIRMARLVRMFPELWLIVSGLLNSMRTLAWVALLLLILLYVAAIFLTLQVGQNVAYVGLTLPNGREWPVVDLFGSVPRSMLTLFQVITLDSWADDIARPIMTLKPEMGFFFILLILIGTYGILNIIVGVIVENTLGTSSSMDKDLAENVTASKRVLLSSLRRLFDLSDSDNSGTLTREELQAALAIPEVLRKFDELHIAVDELEHLFYLMDTTSSNCVKIEDFFTACSQLIRGHTSDDVTQLAMQMESLSRRLDQLDKSLRSVESETEETKQFTLQFMEEVIPKLIGAAHTSGKLDNASVEKRMSQV